MIKGINQILLIATQQVSRVKFWKDDLNVDIENIDDRVNSYVITAILSDYKSQVLNLLATASPMGYRKDKDLVAHYEKNPNLLKLLFLINDFSQNLWLRVVNRFIDRVSKLDQDLVYPFPRRVNSNIQKIRMIIVLFLTDPALLYQVHLLQIAEKRGFRQIDLTNFDIKIVNSLMNITESNLQNIADELSYDFSGVEGEVLYIGKLIAQDLIYSFFKSEYKRDSIERIRDTNFDTAADWFILQLNPTEQQMRIASSGAKIGKSFFYELNSQVFADEKLQFVEYSPCYDHSFINQFVNLAINDTEFLFHGIRLVSILPRLPLIQIEDPRYPIGDSIQRLIQLGVISLDINSEVKWLKVEYRKHMFTIYFEKCVENENETTIYLGSRNNQFDLMEFEKYLLENYGITPMQGRGKYL